MGNVESAKKTEFLAKSNVVTRVADCEKLGF